MEKNEEKGNTKDNPYDNYHGHNRVNQNLKNEQNNNQDVNNEQNNNQNFSNLKKKR